MDTETFIKQSEDVAKDLYASGEKGRAIQIKKTVRKAKKHIKTERAKQTKAKSEILNFDNPTPAMIEDAQKFGLDLNDPAVRAELNQLK